MSFKKLSLVFITFVYFLLVSFYLFQTIFKVDFIDPNNIRLLDFLTSQQSWALFSSFDLSEINHLSICESVIMDTNKMLRCANNPLYASYLGNDVNLALAFNQPSSRTIRFVENLSRMNNREALEIVGKNIRDQFHLKSKKLYFIFHRFYSRNFRSEVLNKFLRKDDVVEINIQ